MELYDKYKEDGLEIIGMSMGAPPNMVKLFMEKTGMNYPNFIAGKDVLEAYSVRAVPFNIFFGRDGKERARELGYNEQKKKEIEKEVAGLLRE